MGQCGVVTSESGLVERGGVVELRVDRRSAQQQQHHTLNIPAVRGVTERRGAVNIAGVHLQNTAFIHQHTHTRARAHTHTRTCIPTESVFPKAGRQLSESEKICQLKTHARSI